MIVRLALDAMGTRFELVLAGGDEHFLRASGEEAIEEIREQHDRLSVFSRGSLVSRINAEAGERPVAVDADLAELLGVCARVQRSSGGAFDPAVGALMSRWGFRPDGACDDAAAGGDAVVFDQDAMTVRFTRPGIKLDFGGVAKGFALDRAASILRKAGIGRALIHGGTSSAIAIGAPPDRAAWAIEIPSQRGDVRGVWCRLRDRALAVSSPAGRTVRRGGATVGHIMNPRSGVPAYGATVAAVVTDSAAEADAWATALVVLGTIPASMPGDADSAILAQSAPRWTFAPDPSRVFGPEGDR